MIKFTYKNDGKVLTLVTDEITLGEILVEFEQFLRGAGFSFDGHVTIEESEE
jgi:hypothetical protein